MHFKAILLCVCLVVTARGASNETAAVTNQTVYTNLSGIVAYDALWGAWYTNNATAGSNTVTSIYLADGTNWTAWGAALARDFVVGPVTIDTATGCVTIEDGATLDEASLEFWKGVEKAWPYMFENHPGKEKGML